MFMFVSRCMRNPNDTGWVVIFPQCSINRLAVWGDGGSEEALMEVSHPYTTAHSCPPGAARAMVTLHLLYTYTHSACDISGTLSLTTSLLTSLVFGDFFG